MKISALLKIKVKGGALLYVIFLCLMIFLLLLSFLLKNQLDRDFISLKGHEFFYYENLNSAISAAISQSDINTFDPTNIPGDEISLRIFNWGAYSVINAIVNKYPDHFHKTILVGQEANGGENISLYLRESNRKTYISGKCNITGTAYIPELGIKTCYVGGSSFRGKRYINGNSLTSAKKLPEINKIETPIIGDNDSLIFYEEIAEQDSIINSFNDKTYFIEGNEKLSLNYKFILGNVIISSNKSITIRSNSYIEDAVLSAPYIRICSGFEGSLQCIASDSILVERDCNLKYPSTLILNNQTDTTFHKIEIKKGSIIHSDLIAYGKQSKVIVRRDNNLIGRIYSPGQVEIESPIIGSCYCGELYRKVNGMVYTNTIYNNEINPETIPIEWAGSLMFDNHKIPIKCLH